MAQTTRNATSEDPKPVVSTRKLLWLAFAAAAEMIQGTPNPMKTLTALLYDSKHITTWKQ